MFCDELLLRSHIPTSKQFQGVTVQEAFGRPLTSISEFEIDVEIIDKFNQFSIMYGNKHIDERTK
jgi:hypothetical protein